jgi:DNA-binding NarL/FixJ family response regulator
VHAETLREGYEVAELGPDIVLLDLGLVETQGTTTILEWLHNSRSSAPLVVLSGTADSEMIDEARSLGVARYLQKQHLTSLEGEVGASRLVQLLETTVRQAGASSTATRVH